jgi:hypothetical protein
MESTNNSKGKFGKSALDMKPLGELKGNKDVSE